MDKTPRLKLPYMEMSQAQKEVTHNEALSILEGITCLWIRQRQSSPSEGRVSGDAVLVGASPLGAWAGKAGYISYIGYNQAEFLIQPFKGLRGYIESESSFLQYNGTEWSNMPINNHRHTGGVDGVKIGSLGIENEAIAAVHLQTDAIITNIGYTPAKQIGDSNLDFAVKNLDINGDLILKQSLDSAAIAGTNPVPSQAVGFIKIKAGNTYYKIPAYGD